MAQITWLGEGDDGPEENVGFRGMVFKKGEPVETDDEDILARASKNRYFEVSGWEPPEGEPEQLVHVPPSQQMVPGPVPKGGEPLVPRVAPAPKAEEPKVELTEDQPKPKWPKL